MMAKKVLIAYYSHSGNTEKLAKAIQSKTDGVLFEVKEKDPYPQNHQAVVDQAKKEIGEGFKPALKAKVDDIDTYDTVFVGSPNWWYTIAPPVATFLAEHDMTDKTIIPFYTHGGGGAGSIEKDIAKLCPGSKLQGGLSFEFPYFFQAQSKRESWGSKSGGRKKACKPT